MKMKLMSLKIRNFMGCKELDIEFDGANMKIFGDNATGKTTIQHAFNWLLFDKNAVGKTDFNMIPIDENGNVIHRLETSVEALFDIDGFPKQFKKVLQEKWVRRRGSADESYQGTECGFYVNTVPKKKKEFTEEIAKVIDESLFRMITNPLYFNENIKWQDRRKILLDICGHISDEEVINLHRELEPLRAILQGRTVEELKSIVSSEMKSINKELGIIPSRIAEADLAKPTPREDVDVSQLKTLEEQKQTLIQKKSDILNGADILRAKAKLDVMKNDIEKKRAEVFNKFNIVEYAELDKTSKRIAECKAMIDNLANNTIPSCDVQLNMNKRRKQELSDEWDKWFKMSFFGTHCPTCNQELPPEQLEEKKREFNTTKASKLDAIEKELAAIKKEDSTLYVRTAEAKGLIEKLESEIKALESKSSELTNALAEFEQNFNASKEETVNRLLEEYNDLKNDIIEQELNAEDKAKEVDVEIAEVDIQIKPITDYIAEQNMIKKQDERIEELKTQQEKLSRRYTYLDEQLFLTEEFIRCKVSMINEKINQYFKYTRFQLFDVQVNGGIVETCEATYKGIPYADLNSAGRVNIGLDIINTLSTKFGSYAPIIIDNMESVTKPIDTVAQRIELIVSENDKKLRFEKEN